MTVLTVASTIVFYFLVGYGGASLAKDLVSIYRLRHGKDE